MLLLRGDVSINALTQELVHFPAEKQTLTVFDAGALKLFTDAREGLRVH